MYYSVEKSLDSSFTIDVEVHYALSNNFIDTEVEENTQYFYRVSYYAGQWSEYSDFIAVVFNAVMDVAETGTIPAVYSIHQNYPNPFNPTTTIEYSLDQNRDVELSIYSITGELIRTLDSGSKTAGVHKVMWNGLDNRSHQVASGIYIYTISAGEFNATKRLVLLR